MKETIVGDPMFLQAKVKLMCLVKHVNDIRVSKILGNDVRTRNTPHHHIAIFILPLCFIAPSFFGESSSFGENETTNFLFVVLKTRCKHNKTSYTIVYSGCLTIWYQHSHILSSLRLSCNHPFLWTYSLSGSHGILQTPEQSKMDCGIKRTFSFLCFESIKAYESFRACVIL